jgi:tetratricopeptide (TPR) repeat protein
MRRVASFFKLFYNPLQAMIELGADARYVFGSLLALVSTVLFSAAINGQLAGPWISLPQSPRTTGPFIPLILIVSQVVRRMASIAAPLFFLVAVFVPACLLAVSMIEKRASFTVLLRQEYAGLTSCALHAWTAAHLMMMVIVVLLYHPTPVSAAALARTLSFLPFPYFLVLIVVAVRAVFRISFPRAIGTVALASCSLLALPLLPRFLFMLTSPFILILVILLLRNILQDLVSTQRARENFERNLETATLNPADSSAHYNLGLIYQQRRQYKEARASFERAIEIDPDEIDAHYQLGRIALEEKMLGEAINRFDAVVTRNPEHSQSEVWREIGRAYFDAGQFEDAAGAFERFLERRPSDAEGRYRYGLTLDHLGQKQQAAEEMRACIEAVRTSPSYKYRVERRWATEAQSFLRSQAASSQ